MSEVKNSSVFSGPLEEIIVGASNSLKELQLFNQKHGGIVCFVVSDPVRPGRSLNRFRRNGVELTYNEVLGAVIEIPREGYISIDWIQAFVKGQRDIDLSTAQFDKITRSCLFIDHVALGVFVSLYFQNRARVLPYLENSNGGEIISDLEFKPGRVLHKLTKSDGRTPISLDGMTLIEGEIEDYIDGTRQTIDGVPNEVLQIIESVDWRRCRE